MNRLLVAALLATAVLLPTAQAQTPTGVTLTVTTLASPIPYAGTASIPVTVRVGCADILTTMGSMTVTVAAVSPPAWLTATPASIPIDPQGCPTNSGFVTGTGSVPVAVTKDAPGVVEHTINFTATLGQGSVSAPVGTVVTVAYHPIYSLSTDAKFPLTMTKSTVTFNLTVTQASNARSMVMMEEVKQSAGVISGLASVVYNVPETKVFKVTYKAPDGAWNKTTVSFKGYSHYLLLDSRAGPFDAGTPITWEFHNGGIAPAKTDSKKSPMPVGGLLALGLVGLAALARRRA